jgi:hypothetical protein
MSKPRLKPCVLALERLEDRCTPAAPGGAWPPGLHPGVPAVSDAPAGVAADPGPAPDAAGCPFVVGVPPAAHGLYTALLNEAADGPAPADFGIKIDAPATPARGLAARVFTGGPIAVAALVKLHDPDHDALASGPQYTDGPGPHPGRPNVWSDTTDASNHSTWNRPYYL